MYKMLMTSCGSTVEIESDINLYNMVKKYIAFIDLPEVSLKECKHNINCKYKVRYRNNNKRVLEFRENSVLIHYPIEEMENGLSILFMAYPLIEAGRRKKKNLTCHSASVSIDGKGILILGKEGAGKTTLAIELCKKFDAKLIGNDLCVLDYSDLNRLRILGGTKYIFLRYESIKRNMPELLKTFKILQNKDISDTWIYKEKVLPIDIGVKIENNIVDIEKIYIVHIDQEKSFFCKVADSLTDILYINENFSRYIRNTCTTMISKNKVLDYVPSLDNKNFYLERKKLINYLFDNKKIQYVSGNILDVSKYIFNGGKK